MTKESIEAIARELVKIDYAGGGRKFVLLSAIEWDDYKKKAELIEEHKHFEEHKRRRMKLATGHRAKKNLNGKTKDRGMKPITLAKLKQPEE